MNNKNNLKKELIKMKHPLAKKRHSLVSPVGWKAEKLNDLYNQLDILFDNYDHVAAETLKKTEQLKPEFQAQEQSKALAPFRIKLETVLNNETRTLARSRQTIAEKIQKAKEPARPTSEIAELLHYLRGSEIRQELRQMDGKSQRDVISKTCERGDRSVIDAAKDSLAEIVNPKILALGQKAWDDFAIDRNDQTNLDILDGLLDSIQTTSSAVDRYLEDKNAELGLKSQKDLERDTAAANKAVGLTQAERAEFIGKHGLESFQRVTSGKAAIGDFALDAAQQDA
ncbi:MAG: hypothetical protein PF482_14490 [Desulfobacteraceae bacterium]|jgi:hypothetical protein|nr:hypothetical protein [Desulfobacteraceae bacterium]